MAKKVVSIDEDQINKWIEKGVKKLENLDCGKKSKAVRCAIGGGCAWFLGFCGALVYFWQYVTSFGTGVVAFVKACIWPAFLIFHLFRFLKI